MNITVYARKSSPNSSKTFPIEIFYAETSNQVYLKFKYEGPETQDAEDYDDYIRRVSVDASELMKALKLISKYPTLKMGLPFKSDNYNSYPTESFALSGTYHEEALENTIQFGMNHIYIFFDIEELKDVIETQME